MKSPEILSAESSSMVYITTCTRYRTEGDLDEHSCVTHKLLMIQTYVPNFTQLVSVLQYCSQLLYTHESEEFRPPFVSAILFDIRH